MQLNVNEFVLTKLDPECGLAQPQLVMFNFDVKPIRRMKDGVVIVPTHLSRTQRRRTWFGMTRHRKIKGYSREKQNFTLNPNLQT